MDKIEHLKKIYDTRINSEHIGFTKILNKEDPYYIIPFFEGDNVVYAIQSIYIEKSINKSKLFFYKAARIAEYMSNKYDQRIVDSGINQISYAMLSDNADLIHRYTLLHNKVNNETGIGYQFTNSVQNILLNNREKLDWNIHCLERLVKIPRFKWCAGVVPVLNGFKQEDKTLIENGLQELLTTHKKRNDDPLISRFFSIDTAGFCKLAWIKGYEIDLQSTFVPIKLMPIKPLEHYEDYEFLKDNL